MTDINDMLKQLDSYRREHGIDICVIDDSGFVGTAAAITHAGEIYMDSAESMVNNVLKERGPYMIRRLDILDHGNEHSFSLGSDWIDNDYYQNTNPCFPSCDRRLVREWISSICNIAISG